MIGSRGEGGGIYGLKGTSECAFLVTCHTPLTICDRPREKVTGIFWGDFWISYLLSCMQLC